MSVDRRKLGLKIRMLRKAAGLSQHAMAAKTELNRSSIANIETGRQSIGLDKLAVLAHALGTTVAALLAEDNALLAKLAGQQRAITQTLTDMSELVLQLAQQAERTEKMLTAALNPDPEPQEEA